MENKLYSLNALFFEKLQNECRNPSFLHKVTYMRSDHTGTNAKFHNHGFIFRRLWYTSIRTVSNHRVWNHTLSPPSKNHHSYYCSMYGTVLELLPNNVDNIASFSASNCRIASCLLTSIVLALVVRRFIISHITHFIRACSSVLWVIFVQNSFVFQVLVYAFDYILIDCWYIHFTVNKSEAKM